MYTYSEYVEKWQSLFADALTGIVKVDFWGQSVSRSVFFKNEYQYNYAVNEYELAIKHFEIQASARNFHRARILLSEIIRNQTQLLL